MRGLLLRRAPHRPRRQRGRGGRQHRKSAGQQGSLAVYHCLRQAFATLDATAAEHGLALFAEHTADARNRPDAHPNIDRLLAIAAGGAPLRIDVIAGGG